MSKQSIEDFAEILTTSSDDMLLLMAAIMTETTTRSDPIQDSEVYMNRLYLNYELLQNKEWVLRQFKQARD